MQKDKLTIVKVGGAIIEDEHHLEKIVKDFSQIKGKKILVHGGGRLATSTAMRLGIQSKIVEGRRITDMDMLEVVTMVYAGKVNKKIVALLQACGVDALGLTGADMNAILSHKRKVKDIDYGFVGDIDQVNSKKLGLLIENGITPIMAPLTHDGKGCMLNTNADTIASSIAKALAKDYDVTLIFCFEKKGVLRNVNDEDSVIAQIREKDFERLLKEGVISEGMIPKLENAFDAIKLGVKKVNITQATAIDGHHGTMILPDE